MKMLERSGVRITSAILVGAVVCSSGCSAFQPRQQSVTIASSQKGAEIYLNNNPIGTSPVTIMLDRDKTYAVSASIDGRSGSAAIGRRVSGTGVLDIVGGVLFLVPFIGCFTPGFWELDPTTVHVPIPETRAVSDGRAR